MSWAAQHYQHQLLTFYEHHFLVGSHHMEQGYLLVLALMFCTCERSQICVSRQDEVEVAKLEFAAYFTTI